MILIFLKAMITYFTVKWKRGTNVIAMNVLRKFHEILRITQDAEKH
jgi:hypothetical protein